ncbi:MAG: ribosome maturation factor RimP [Bdellovibrionales bacterium]|nr:ribosome maturation factor RimP [Bdellovibrionales bacterium]NQZ19522.1 ribosome maturation factor RimP [Bdellovibrionales bacterium]
MSAVLEKLEKHAQQVAEREDCFLYDLELVGAGKNRILRIFIDKEGEEGVSIDDCSNVSRGMDLILDVDDLVPGGGYQLEVSSPGLDRHLTKGWHYNKVQGQSVNVRLKTGLGLICEGLPEKENKRKKLVGKIIEADDQTVRIEMEAKKEDPLMVTIPLEEIHKAKLVFDYDKLLNKQPKKKKNKRG